MIRQSHMLYTLKEHFRDMNLESNYAVGNLIWQIQDTSFSIYDSCYIYNRATYNVQIHVYCIWIIIQNWCTYSLEIYYNFYTSIVSLNQIEGWYHNFAGPNKYK